MGNELHKPVLKMDNISPRNVLPRFTSWVECIFNPGDFCAVTTPALEFRDVGLRIGSADLLSHVTFSVPEGKSLVLVGPSGSGKSLILKLAAGLLVPTSGEVLVFGRNLLTLPASEAQSVLLSLGMLFQKNALFDSLSVFENVAFPLRERSSLSEQEIVIRCDQLLVAVGLDHARSLFPHEISGGMQKRLGIARALALNPKMIFYDDPTAGLDPITSRKIASLLSNLSKERNTTMVTITNDMMRALQLSDFIAFVHNRTLNVIGDSQIAKSSKSEPFRSFFRGQIH